MQIQSSQQLFQHIEAGGHLTLNSQGQLESQKGISHFFQSIADAFRSLTAGGKQTIATRNAHLHAAMQNMVRQEMQPNLTDAYIPSPELAQTKRSTFMARLAIARELSQLPPEARSAARNLVELVLNKEGLLQGEYTPAVSRRARELTQTIIGNPDIVRGLRCSYSRTQQEMQPMLNQMVQEMRDAFMREKDSNIKENGLHNAYLKDAERENIRSVNGQPPNAADYDGQLLNLLPNDPKIRAFVSMAASQSGMEATLSLQFLKENLLSDFLDGLDSYFTLPEHGLAFSFDPHTYDITVNDQEIRISLDMQSKVTVTDFGRASFEGEAPVLGGGRYRMDLVIRLPQDMSNKDIPDFTLENASRTPLELEP